MMCKVIIAAVGFIYVGLGMYCTVLPVQVAQAFGMMLTEPAALGEFFTVYGGLEFGFGVGLVLAATWRTEWLAGVCGVGLCVHVGLLLWRVVSILRWGADPLLLGLAGVDATLCVAFVVATWQLRAPAPASEQ